MTRIDKVLGEIGYVEQTTPAGRVIWVNPQFYPLTEEQLANEDDFFDETYQDYLDQQYEDWQREQEDIFPY